MLVPIPDFHRRHRGLPFPRPEAHLGLVARAERHSLPELMELGGWKSYEMVLRYARLAPEKLSSVAGRIERQASRPIEAAPRGPNVAKNAAFSLRSLN